MNDLEILIKVGVISKATAIEFKKIVKDRRALEKVCSTLMNYYTPPIQELYWLKGLLTEGEYLANSKIVAEIEVLKKQNERD